MYTKTVLDQGKFSLTFHDLMKQWVNKKNTTDKLRDAQLLLKENLDNMDCFGNIFKAVYPGHSAGPKTPSREAQQFANELKAINENCLKDNFNAKNYDSDAQKTEIIRILQSSLRTLNQNLVSANASDNSANLNLKFNKMALDLKQNLPPVLNDSIKCLEKKINDAWFFPATEDKKNLQKLYELRTMVVNIPIQRKQEGAQEFLEKLEKDLRPFTGIVEIIGDLIKLIKLGATDQTVTRTTENRNKVNSVLSTTDTDKDALFSTNNHQSSYKYK